MAYRSGMTMRHLRRRTAALILDGIGDISFDHSIRMPRLKSSRDAVADDWHVVGQDLRRAIKHAGTGSEAA